MADHEPFKTLIEKIPKIKKLSESLTCWLMGPTDKRHLTFACNTSNEPQQRVHTVTCMNETVFVTHVGVTALSKQTIRISCNSETIDPRTI